jgi:hypothetical protein
MEEGS